MILKKTEYDELIKIKDGSEALKKSNENFEDALKKYNSEGFKSLEEKDKYTKQLEVEIKKKDGKIFEQGQAIEKQAAVIVEKDKLIKALKKEKSTLKGVVTRLKNSRNKKETIVRDGREYVVIKEKDEKISKGQKLKVKSGARTSKIIKDMKEGK